jgi:hypothetical protein
MVSSVQEYMANAVAAWFQVRQPAGQLQQRTAYAAQHLRLLAIW